MRLVARQRLTTTIGADMNAQEFEAKYYEDGEIYGDNVKCVESGDEIAEHKTVYNTDVYEVTSGDVVEYFEVTFSRSNSGYWGDSERYDPEFKKVKPVEEVVTVTRWVAA